MEQKQIESATADMVDSLRVIFEAELAKNTEAASTLERSINLLSDLHLDPERAGPQQQAVCQYLPRALDLGVAGPAAAVAEAIRELEPSLHWRQNPKYNVENKGAHFMENYAFTDFGLVGSSVLYIGAVLLGPGATYPLSTYMGSEGVFLVVGGSPEWKCGDGPWEPTQAGDIIWRPMDGAEGKKPGDEPMLALYAWLY